ncbi:MAG: Nramp family divalent metal transporter [Isosphaeraceae bacterium]|nr:Nramp family divalent metal transporter [Isosphaeraceae bacterium]
MESNSGEQMSTGGRASLDEVHRSVDVGHGNPLKRLFAFMGPAYLVSVGYMDPGNWATDLEGGARFGYALIWVLLMSNVMAVLLQTLCARLGVVTGHDLAQASRAEYSRPVNFCLWLLAEIAIAACDLAEVLGTIIALKLLFGMNMLWGCVVTAFDTFLLLWLQKWGVRRMEAVILTLVVTIGACFLVQIVIASPDLGEVAAGFRPSLPPGALFVAIGILGATVMPHNLYLHSALVQSRRIGKDDASKAQACRLNLVDTTLALNAAFFVNAAILVLSASVFHGSGEEVASIERAHELLPRFLDPIAPYLFGIALLCAGQSSTLTGTLAGQIVMEGYLHIRLAPWLRRLITRMIALVPAVIVIAIVGESSTQQLLVLSQVILSLQLSFAVIPLIHFTSNKKNMGRFANPIWVQILSWVVAAIIVALNAKLVIDKAIEWVEMLDGVRYLGIPLDWAAGVLLAGTIGGAAVLLAWITIKPWFRPAAPWSPAPSVELDWSGLAEPRQAPRRIGIALEHDPADSEIIAHALGSGRPDKTSLLLLHVVDTPMTRVYGAETADREATADEQYLSAVSAELTGRGYRVDTALLHGPDRAAQLLSRLRDDPVDLLVVGSHGHGWVRDLLFGQTVDRVRHGLTIPMLIVRPDRSVGPAEVYPATRERPAPAEPT